MLENLIVDPEFEEKIPRLSRTSSANTAWEVAATNEKLRFKLRRKPQSKRLTENRFLYKRLQNFSSA